LWVVIASGIGLSACGDGNDTSTDSTGDDVTSTSTTSGATDELRRDVIADYAIGVHATYAASLASATEMEVAIIGFLADPSDSKLEAAKTAWLDARADYGITEAYRFSGGPIDDDATGPEGRMNAWPMDEAYIDYVEGDPDAGIINDPTGVPDLTHEVLADANEADGETSIATGWHAIEFLLWGQDLSTDGPGTRPVSDYIDAPNADRRSKYLAVVSQLLLNDLATIVEAWDPAGTDNYAATFLALPADEALTRMITGIGELGRGELAGERMIVAYEERDQENEHSCFSDNTTADLASNAQGIMNVWTGDYPGLAEGVGFDELVAAVDPNLARDTTRRIEASIARIADIPAPFDRLLTADVSDDDPGRVAILESTELLSTQTDNVVAVASALGLAIEVS
jgi:putative iron-regulated protein